MEKTTATARTAIITPYAKASARVETTLSEGTGIVLNGAPEQAAKECILRVATALIALGYTLPGKHIEINVIPELPAAVAGIPHLDLPVAATLLALIRGKEIPDDLVLAGELGLCGELRETPVTWTLFGDFLHGRLPGRRLVTPLPRQLSGAALPGCIIAAERLDDIAGLLA